MSSYQFQEKIISRFEKIVFQILIFFLPTQLTYHFWPDWALILGVRVDYLAPTVYLTDIFIFLLFLLSFRNLNWKPVFKIGFLFLILASLNIFFARVQIIAFWKWLKFFELLFFFYYLSQQKEKVLTQIKTPLRASLIYILLLGFGQFFLQSSIAGEVGSWTYFLGERSFNFKTPGISRFYFGGKEYLRPYATFPHPNVLAGYLLVSNLLLLINDEDKKMKFKNLILNFSFLFFSFLLILLSFSQAVWLVGFLVLILFLFKKEELSTKLIFLPIVVSLFLSVILSESGNFFSNSGDSIKERVDLVILSGEFFAKKPFLGIGLGNFVINRFLQPVHNVYLLVLTEAGVLSFIFLLFLFFKIQKQFAGKNHFLKLAFLAIALIGFLDHYWLTLQQSQLLLFLVLGVLFNPRTARIKKKKGDGRN